MNGAVSAGSTIGNVVCVHDAPEFVDARNTPVITPPIFAVPDTYTCVGSDGAISIVSGSTAGSRFAPTCAQCAPSSVVDITFDVNVEPPASAGARYADVRTSAACGFA